MSELGVRLQYAWSAWEGAAPGKTGEGDRAGSQRSWG